MSEFDTEGPTPKQQRPARRFAGYTAPVAPVNKVDPHWTQIADAITSIATINEQVRDSLVGTVGALKALKDELNTAGAVRQNQGAPPRHRDSRGIVSDLHEDPQGVDPAVLAGRAASQQELEHQRNEDLQMKLRRAQIQRQFDQADSEASQQLAAYRSLKVPQQIDELRRRGVVNAQGGTEGAQIGGDFKTTDELTQILGTPANKRSGEDQGLVEILNQEFKERITDELAKKAPSTVEKLLDAVENSGIRQLRYGELTMQDILRSTGTLAGTAAVKMGDYQIQQQRYAEWQTQAAQATANGQEPPPEPPNPMLSHPGIAGRILGGGAGLAGFSGAARVLPVAGQALAIAGIVNRLGQRLYGSIYNQYSAATKSGQITGQGTEAGIAARVKGFTLGLNPFDLTSQKDAAEMVAATRQAGFTGRNADAMENGLRDVVNHLGISVSQASDYFVDALRQGGLSVAQVRTQMDAFHDSARELNMSVSDYTAQMLANVQSLRASGAGAAAPALAASQIAALPVGFRNAQGEQFFSQMFQQNRGAIVPILQQQGINANYGTVSSARYAAPARGALDTLIEQDMATAARLFAVSNPGVNPTDNDLANLMSQWGAHTTGMDPQLLTQYIKKISAGTGISNQVAIHHAVTQLQSRISGQQTRQHLTYDQMTDEQRKALGLRLEHGRGPAYLAGVKTASGEAVGHSHVFSVMSDPGQIPKALLEQYQRQAIDSLGKAGVGTTLTPDDRKRLEGLVGTGGFMKALENVGKENRKINNNQVMVHGVSIELTGAATRQLLAFNKITARSIGDATLQANQSPLAHP